MPEAFTLLGSDCPVQPVLHAVGSSKWLHSKLAAGGPCPDGSGGGVHMRAACPATTPVGLRLWLEAEVVGECVRCLSSPYWAVAVVHLACLWESVPPVCPAGADANSCIGCPC